MGYLIELFTSISIVNSVVVMIYVFKFVPHEDKHFKVFLEDIYFLAPPLQFKMYKTWLIISCVMLMWLCYLMIKEVFWS